MAASHILFLVSWYPNKKAPALGNFIRQHARAAAMKYTVSVVYATSDAQLAKGETKIEEQHEGNLHEYVVYFGKIKSSAPVIAQLQKRDAYRSAAEAGVDKAIAANGKPSLLHLHVLWPVAIAASAVLKTLKLPFLITEHWSGYLPEDGNYRGQVMKHYSRSLAGKAKHITVVSSRMEKAMRAHGLGNTFSILPNTVDTELFRPAEETHSTDQLQLLHVSMLVDREKNISGLLRVMKKLQSHKNISLRIVGEGPEKETHRAHAKELGVLDKTVFFSGYEDAAGVAAAMQASDALVMFSHFEGMPVTIIEAQCCGLPVIATSTGAIPEMVNEQEGLLVPPGDEAALEKAILTLAEKRSSFSSSAIREKAVNRYSKRAVAAELDRIYTSLLPNGR